tara:strand:- start:49 stop:276 length:228 start_codon:yes stop_codon:yes gene_type:complete
MSKILTSLAAAGFLLATPALGAAVSFESADANGDGNVTMEEAKSVMPDMTEEQFADADADESGGLSKKEFEAIKG